MSRDYIDNPQEDMAFTLRRIDDTLERIAAVLEDMARHEYGYGRTDLDAAELPPADPALVGVS